jgi:hypothetical protein
MNTIDKSNPIEKKETSNKPIYIPGFLPCIKCGRVTPIYPDRLMSFLCVCSPYHENHVEGMKEIVPRVPIRKYVTESE